MSIRNRTRMAATEETVLVQRAPDGTGTKKRVVLYHWDDLPEWQRDNHYIHHGYVRETLSMRECFKSLLYLHNETVNIYSHLVPGALFFALLASCTVLFVPIKVYDTTTAIDYFMLGLFLAGAGACLTLSSAFHCFKSHSLPVSVFGNKLDYLGIVILIVASAVGLIYYCFIDDLHTGLFFITITLVLGAACAMVSLDEKFRKPSLRGFRAAMFVAFGLSNVFPVAYGIIRYGLANTWVRCGLGYVLAEAFFYISGAVLYATRVPERFAPGEYDMFGHSHQIFHFFVVIAACCHATALIQSYTHAHEVVA